jgi:antitoxin CptB
MDLSDHDLLDIHLARKTLEQVNRDLVRDDVVEIVSKLRELR